MLLALMFLVASTPASAEPGKDPQGKSAQAPGQSPSDHPGRGRGGPDQGSSDWTLLVTLHDASGIEPAVESILAAAANNVTVLLELDPNSLPAAGSGLEVLQDLIDAGLAQVQPPGIVTPEAPGQETASSDDCDVLLIGLMKEPPFVDAGLSLDCLMDPPDVPDVPLDRLPGDRTPIGTIDIN